MFISLKRGNTNGVFSKAKPILLSSIIENIDNIKDNKICWPNNDIIDKYYLIFHKFKEEKPTPIWKPFFYLKSEPFYELFWKDRPPIKDLKFPSERLLNSFVSYAKLDDDLWELLQDESNREYLKDVIIKAYLS